MNVILIPFDAHKRHDDKEEPPATDLLELNGRTSLYWTANALAQSNRVRSVQVLSQKSLEAEIRRDMPNDKRFELRNVDEGPLEAITSNFDVTFDQLNLMEQLAKDGVKTPTLLVSCATPHWRGKIYDDIITYVRDSSLDSAAFYVQHKNVRTSIPEVKTDPSSISFFKQRLHILPLAVVGPEFVIGASRQKQHLSPQLERFMRAEEEFANYERAESPGFKYYFPLGVKVAKLVGFRFLHSLFKRNLSPDLIEKTVRRIFDVRFECIELNDPTLPLTLSNKAHHAKIESLLASK